MFEIDNSYGLEKTQQRLLKTLMVFDNICRENGIQYSLHGGTLLGAERNHQFIPWDDDVDVSMTRIEYNRFKEVIESKCYPKVFLYENVLWVSRFVCATTTEDPVFIDILIYDYISENKIFAFLKINFLRILQGMLKPKENLVFRNRNFIYRISICVTYLLGKLFSQKWKLNMYHNISENHFVGEKSKIHRANDSFYGLPYIFDKEFMKDYSEIELEGYSFMVNVRYKEFLRRNYGEDYLTPPPDKERTPQHEVIRERISIKLEDADGRK